MEQELQNKKLDVLLHYEAAFREDWRILHKLRILVASFFIALCTGIIGWFAKLNSTPSELVDKDLFIFLLIALSLTAIACMAWFASSINTLKRFIVQIEKSLKLMEEGFFIDNEAIIPVQKDKWGKHSFWKWGKAIGATIIFSVFFIGVIKAF